MHMLCLRGAQLHRGPFVVAVLLHQHSVEAVQRSLFLQVDNSKFWTTEEVEEMFVWP